MKEDMEHAKATRDEKPKGQPKFLQKYAHKGAFHQVRAFLPFPPPTSFLLSLHSWMY